MHFTSFTVPFVKNTLQKSHGTTSFLEAQKKRRKKETILDLEGAKKKKKKKKKQVSRLQFFDFQNRFLISMLFKKKKNLVFNGKIR